MSHFFASCLARVQARLPHLLKVGAQLLALSWAFASPAGAGAFADPLNTPALMRSSVAGRPLLAVTQAGARLVAVGSRGVIAVSDDQGQHWQQSRVPVQSDLLAVHFPTPKLGWAVGHDGVILHSADGGTTWAKQLDGVQASTAFVQYYKQLDRGSDAKERERIQKALSTLERNFKAGPALPYLDVWFTDAKTGYVVGSFGMLATTQDGGKSWQPGLHRMDNPEQLNLNAIRDVGGRLLVAAERGRIFQYEAGAGHFTETSTGYSGSFFGFVGNPQAILAFGLQGVVYRSTDQGHSWVPADVPGKSMIAAGAARPDAKGFMLANAAGQLIVANATATEFRLLGEAQTMRYTGVAWLDSQTVLTTGFSGIKARRLATISVASD